MTEAQDRLISVVEAARRLAVSTFTIRRLIDSKQMHGVRVAGRVLVPQSELDRVVAKGCGKYAADV